MKFCKECEKNLKEVQNLVRNKNLCWIGYDDWRFHNGHRCFDIVLNDRSCLRSVPICGSCGKKLLEKFRKELLV